MLLASKINKEMLQHYIRDSIPSRECVIKKSLEIKSYCFIFTAKAIKPPLQI